MPFSAKSAVPCVIHTAFCHPRAEQAAQGGITLFSAPPGYIPSDDLAAVLHRRDVPTLWLRLGAEDHDPALFLLSLIHAAQRLSPAAGAATLEQMQRYPGPAAGWASLFSYQAREMSDVLPKNSALVLENIHHLDDANTTLWLLGAHLLPGLATSMTCVLLSDRDVPRAALPARTIQQGIGGLGLDGRMALRMARGMGSNLTASCIIQATALLRGCQELIAGLCAAGEVLGPMLVQDLVERSTSAIDLLSRLTQAYLLPVSADSISRLALALRLHYAHPDLLQAVDGHGAVPSGPWIQPLLEGWQYIRPVWRIPLRSALRAAATPRHDYLHRAADYLVTQEAIEQAVSLYFELGDTASAAQTIARVATTALDLGEWETLGNWLRQLPPATLRQWPWLVYIAGELATARGDMTAARRAFAMAAVLFTTQHDADGACQSLLAESALAAAHGAYDHAQARALAARAMAEAAHLVRQQSWAAWLLGCLAARAGAIDDAITQFSEAVTCVSALDDVVILDLLRLAERLARQQREFRRQSEFHQNALHVAEQAELESAQHLHHLLSTPSPSLPILLGSHGWTRTPMAIRLPVAIPSPDILTVPKRASLWDTLLQAIGHRPPSVRGVQSERSIIAIPGMNPCPIPADAATVPARDADAAATAGVSVAPLATDTAPVTPSSSGDGGRTAGSLPAVAPSTVSQTVLSVHMLGVFRVFINDRLVESWPHGRGQAIFKYLLYHHNCPTLRDVLMDTFWPEADPAAARNSLNVAVHSLRQSIRPFTDTPVVVFCDGAYRLNSGLRLWLDVEEFEMHIRAGRKLETSGQISLAVAEYEVAAGLYQGDFLANDPYEEWTVLTCESLRVAYLDTLDHLSQIYFGHEQYAPCVSLLQLILARDNCREDAHCRLMRCYSRQGQHHLAIRQYQSCVEALRRELGVAPALSITQLYEHIRRRDPV